MTLAGQMIGKRVRGVLGGPLANGQVVAAVEVTSATNIGLALTTLLRQVKSTRGDTVIIAIKV